MRPPGAVIGAVTGLAMLGVAVVLAPGWGRPAVLAGVPAVLLTPPVRTRSAAAVTAAAIASLATAMGGRGGLAVLGEGLLVAGYLLVTDAIGEPRPLRLTLPALAGALAGGGVVALALLLPVTPRTALSLVLALVGLTAIAVAYALALPLRPRARPERR